VKQGCPSAVPARKIEAEWRMRDRKACPPQYAYVDTSIYHIRCFNSSRGVEEQKICGPPRLFRDIFIGSSLHVHCRGRGDEQDAGIA
jgi:hypothetical protein